MHYSNWLIGVKNRASLRNACKTPPNTDWNKRGNVVDMQNNNPQPNEKISERMVTTHLWKKGKEVNYATVKTLHIRACGEQFCLTDRLQGILLLRRCS